MFFIAVALANCDVYNVTNDATKLFCNPGAAAV